ncbi:MULTISPECIES: M14 family metallopeptidase [unclassified Flavobacterium]|uniref:M14 family metallopeptidase n=1 Tax=unclassified Flavobacterium TaxID=196869 RepID=UPI000A7FAF25|nr:MULTISPECIES: M14 family metallopeptidase [unclassified Flavobacterium]MBN9285806.1 M14 family metallopeptidase [Flavobacterium sp.]
MKFIKILLILPFLHSLPTMAQQKFPTPYEKGNGNQTATYEETIAYFQLLDQNFETIAMKTMGQTDSGEPLHIVTFNPGKNFDFPEIQKNKAVLLINNGIHPGEPDGIDATMMLFRDLATGKITAPKNTVVVAIPIYNIGGALNRNSTSRVNQNGPEEFGFRGNARNYDLNRDFVKSDTRNARSFAEIFQLVYPDVFIDNHVSNGADYQYTLTYISTHYQKLGGTAGTYFNTDMYPAILKDLQSKKIEPVPYVNIYNKTPENGFAKNMETARFSTGYAAMFNSFGAMVETHMLKKYSDRVKVTYEYMITTLNYTDKNFQTIKKIRKETLASYTPDQKYTVEWEIDSAKVTQIPFLGYEGKYKASAVSGKPRLYYDRSKPFKKMIPYYEVYKPKKQVTIPEYYVIPKQWWNVLDLLKLNNIEMKQLKQDTLITVESYRIADYKTGNSAFEGHYGHSNTTVTVEKKPVTFKKGDYLIATQQKNVKFLLETLEPEAVDSYFNWNFFDAVLQQKEYYSPYVFEDVAKQLLDENPELRAALEKKRKSDPKFESSGDAQLDWVYKNSKYYEKSHLQYPVYRIMK